MSKRSNLIDPRVAAAAVERAKRTLARRRLHEFIKQAWHIVEPERAFCDNWHIKAICEHLEAVTDGRIKKLLINVPPGTTKSKLVCVLWPAWVWITYPSKKFFFASYAESLSQRDSVACRSLIESEWYQVRWPMTLRDDMNTKGKWENSSGGWRMATSVGGRGTGEHPNFKIFDDPHNVKEAESDTERQAAIDWWDGTMTSRGAMLDACSVGIMQRLHHKDLSGHLLDKGGWTHICLPMRYEPPAPKTEGGPLMPRMPSTPLGWQDPRTQDGELLWPAVYKPDMLNSLEVDLGSYNVAGQMQQRPSPKGGGTFERIWFQIVDAIPGRILKVVRYWDKAGTKGGKGAESSGLLLAEYDDPNVLTGSPFKKKFCVIDVICLREKAAEREAVIKQTADADSTRLNGILVDTWVEQEPGSGGLESAESTVANLSGHTIFIEKVTGSKEVRAEPLSSQAKVGRVKLLRAIWNGKLLDELEAFPVGKLKDMVDAFSGAFNKLHTPTGAWDLQKFPVNAMRPTMETHENPLAWELEIPMEL